MGLALDELEETNDYVIKNGSLSIVLDDRTKSYIDRGADLTVDFRKSAFGSGFYVNSGSSCC